METKVITGTIEEEEKKKGLEIEKEISDVSQLLEKNEFELPGHYRTRTKSRDLLFGWLVSRLQKELSDELCVQFSDAYAEVLVRSPWNIDDDMFVVLREMKMLLCEMYDSKQIPLEKYIFLTKCFYRARVLWQRLTFTMP